MTDVLLARAPKTSVPVTLLTEKDLPVLAETPACARQKLDRGAWL